MWGWTSQLAKRIDDKHATDNDEMLSFTETSECAGNCGAMLESACNSAPGAELTESY